MDRTLVYTALKGKNKFERLFRYGTFFSSRDISLKILSWNELLHIKNSCETNRSKQYRYQDVELQHHNGQVKSTKASQWTFCVGHKMGNAVLRNRYKRICREALRKTQFAPIYGSLIALFPKKEFVELSISERVNSITKLLKRAGVQSSC